MPKKYLSQGFEKMVTAQTEEEPCPSYMLVTIVSLTDLLGYLFYPQAYREQLWPAFDIHQGKWMFKVETIFHVSLVF